MANTYTQIYIHVVFAVEGRQNLIQPEHNDELQKYITGIVSAQKHKLIAINNMVKKPIPPISDFNPHVDENLNAILSRMLERDRTRRFQRSSECAEELEKYIYSGGYGPTFNTLAAYLKSLFPKFKQASTDSTGTSQAAATEMS